jgi:hypothetical protein
MPANRFAAAFAALALLSGRAEAALIGSCTIEIVSSGEMKSNPSINQLSSKTAGASAAQVRLKPASLLCAVLSLLDCWGVRVDAPAGFGTAPSGGGTGVTFASSYVLGGVEYPGTVETPMPNGTHVVAVHLAAQRAAGVFPAGDYEATVTVRCE